MTREAHPGPSRSLVRRADVLAAALSGLLLALAFPKPDLHLLAWIALVPLLLTARRAGPWRAWWLGFVAGSVYRAVTLYWLVRVMVRYGDLNVALAIAAALSLVFFLAGFVGLFAMAASWFRGPGLGWAGLMAASWVSLEYVQTFIFGGFPWGLVGYAGGRSILMMQAADLAGVYGLSFLTVLFNAALAEWLDERPRPVTVLATAAVVLVAAAGYGAVRLAGAPPRTEATIQVDPAAGVDIPPTPVGGAAGGAGAPPAPVEPATGTAAGRPAVAQELGGALPGEPGADAGAIAALTVGVVQGNVPQRLKWDPGVRLSILADHLRLSRRGVDAAAEMLVWAESSVPSFGGFEADVEVREAVSRLARQEQVPVLVGSPHVERHDGLVQTNAAFLVSPDGPRQRYDKVRLVPFGEYVPFRRLLPFVEPLVEAVADFRAGEPGQPLLADAGAGVGPFAVAICYEVIFPYLVREQVARGARFLVTITNDAWFGDSSAPYQHFAMARMRAVENRRWLVRAANTGISGIIDPWGRVVGSIDLDRSGVLVADVEQRDGLTTYGRWGDLFALACVLVLVGCASVRLVRPAPLPRSAG